MIAQRFRELTVKKNKDGSKVQVTEGNANGDNAAAVAAADDDDTSYFHFEDDIMKKVQSPPSVHPCSIPSSPSLSTLPLLEIPLFPKSFSSPAR